MSMPDQGGTARRTLVRTGVLAFLCGFVDTIAFVHMGGLFVAHVTGNFVLLGATIVGGGGIHSDTTILQIASFPVFILAAFVATLCHDRWPGPMARHLLWGVAILVPTAALWSMAGPGGDIVASMLLVCAMATLNAAQRVAPEIGPPTTVMTGNTTQVAVLLARRVRPGGHAREEKAQWLGMPVLLVGAFLAGCIFGAAGAVWVGLAAVAFPAIPLIVILVLDRNRVQDVESDT